MEELKPCPFCGSQNFCVDATADGWVIVCNGCLAQSPAGIMFIPEFVCGILATIGVEFLLLIGYAIFRKKK